MFNKKKQITREEVFAVVQKFGEADTYNNAGFTLLCNVVKKKHGDCDVAGSIALFGRNEVIAASLVKLMLQSDDLAKFIMEVVNKYAELNVKKTIKDVLKDVLDNLE